MARRKSGSGTAAIVVIFLLVVLIPKKVWIALGIGALIFLAIHLFLKWQKRKAAPANIAHQPTLAELTAKASPPKPRHAIQKTAVTANSKALASIEQAPRQPLVAPQPVATPAEQPAPIPLSVASAQTGFTLHRNLRGAKEHVAHQQPLLSQETAAPSVEASQIILPDLPEWVTTPTVQAKTAHQHGNSNLLAAMRAVTAAAEAAFHPPDSTASPLPPNEDPQLVVPDPPHNRRDEINPAPRTIQHANTNLLAAMRAVVARGAAALSSAPTLPTESAVTTPYPSSIPPPPPLRVDEPQHPNLGVSKPEQSTMASLPIAQPEVPRLKAPTFAEDELHRASMERTPTQQFIIPKPPPEVLAETRWVNSTETVDVKGVTVKGGLFYIGARLATPSGQNESSLINPVLAVAQQGSCHGLDSGYWSGYAELNATERRAYLNWLASGRNDPGCATGYVLLFLYGLERRVLLDGDMNPSTKQEWPAIKSALRDLDTVYGETYGPLRGSITSLLDWMELDSPDSQLYNKPIPAFQRGFELPAYIRLALGQCTLDRVPVPAALALAWVRLSPEIFLRTAATRCADEFDKLFVERYHEVLRAGLLLPKNKTKLKLSRRPSSPTFYGASPTPRTFGDTPDVTALTAPIRTLTEIAQNCTDELASFSRLVGKDPDARTKLEGLLLLPISIWPDAQQSTLASLSTDLQATPSTLTLRQLTDRLGGANATLTRDRIRELAKVLEGSHIGMEPNVLEGVRVPSEADPIVLFSMLPGQSHQAESLAYQTALLTLQLASTVAQSDGEFSDHEAAHLGQEIDGWSHLSQADHRRLRAHLLLLRAAPITMASIKKKLEPLDQAAKEAVAASMATLAQIDGHVSPDEMRFLEKIYKALGVEPKRVFSDVHAGVSGKPNAPKVSAQKFRLDPNRIAQLQKDTAKVSALLADIFVEDSPEPVASPASMTVKVVDVATTGLLGLDEVHSALLRLMLSRPSWSRSELEDGASDLDLMLDGALEQINEAAFDAYDLPFSEGDDPVEINPEFIEKIEQ
jgi:tellurite resistance protein